VALWQRGSASNPPFSSAGGINSSQCEKSGVIYNLKELKQEFGQDLSFWGAGVDTAFSLFLPAFAWLLFDVKFIGPGRVLRRKASFPQRMSKVAGTGVVTWPILFLRPKWVTADPLEQNRFADDPLLDFLPGCHITGIKATLKTNLTINIGLAHRGYRAFYIFQGKTYRLFHKNAQPTLGSLDDVFDMVLQWR
jgi:hypothetical protein